LITVKNQIEAHTIKHSQSESNIKRFEKQAEEVLKKYDQFRADIAILLSDNFVQVSALEEDIKEKLKLLMLSSKDRGIVS
jgi:archaellum component FlaC